MRNLKSGDTATANVTLWEPDTWPTSAKGVGFSEAPRGALGHWIKIANQKIDSYQCVVPTTWNAGPRDDKGQIGAYEAALMGTKLAVPDQPLEILRTCTASIPAWPAPPMLLIIMEGSWSGFRYDDDDSEVSMHLKEITSQGTISMKRRSVYGTGSRRYPLSSWLLQDISLAAPAIDSR